MRILNLMSIEACLKGFVIMRNKTLTKEQVKEKGFVYLSHRDHSEKELAEKLARAGAKEEDIAEAMAFFTEHGFVSDADYAAMRARQLFARGTGRRGVEAELRMKGVDRDIAEEAIEKVMPEFCDTLGQLMKKRLGGDFSRENVRRASAYFARKGFSYGEIKQAAENAQNEYEEEYEDE